MGNVKLENRHRWRGTEYARYRFSEVDNPENEFNCAVGLAFFAPRDRHHFSASDHQITAAEKTQTSVYSHGALYRPVKRAERENGQSDESEGISAKVQSLYNQSVFTTCGTFAYSRNAKSGKGRNGNEGERV